MHRLLSQLMQREISDPRLIGISITRAEITFSGRGMTVWVHRLEVDDPKDCEDRLNRLVPHFMYLLRQALSKQHLPEIRFRWDETMEKSGKVLHMLRELEGEDER
jgi:ribosome-binding factor A